MRWVWHEGEEALLLLPLADEDVLVMYVVLICSLPNLNVWMA